MKQLNTREVIFFILLSIAWLADAAVTFQFNLEKAGFVTLVIEDQNGKRICNLVAEQPFPAGQSSVTWDGYDNLNSITYTDQYREHYKVNKTPVPKGTYVLRGLFHEGIKTYFRGAVYSPWWEKSPPWCVRRPGTVGYMNHINAGGWIGEHNRPVVGIKFKPKGSGMPAEYGPDQDVMIICGEVAESNDLVAWVDMEGRKIYGTHANGWTGKVGWSANECVENSEISGGGFTYRIDKANHNIQVLEGGKEVRRIGKPGGPQLGIYDEQRMHNPNAVALDNQGRLWVAERDDGPRRVSIWKTDGTFIKAIYGPPCYGSGGVIDPKDKTLFYYSHAMGATEVVIEFKIDWKKGDAIPNAIVWRPSLRPEYPTYGGGPENITYVNGRKYFYNTNPGFHRHPVNATMIFLFNETTRTIKPVACVGQVAEWNDPKTHTRWEYLATDEMVARYPSGAKWSDILFAWSDLNFDGKPQPNEFKFKVNAIGKNNSRFTMQEDLSTINAAGFYIPPPSFDANGVPLYDLEKGRLLADIKGPIMTSVDNVYSDAAHQGILAEDGWFVYIAYPMFGFKDGVEKWRYHTEHAPAPAPSKPGDAPLIQKFWGPPVRPLTGEAGMVWGVSSEFGAFYLFTTDGLYIQTLAGDYRQKTIFPQREARLGMEISNYSLGGELFYNRFCQTADGEIFIVGGNECSALLSVEGFEKVKRFAPRTFELTEESKPIDVGAATECNDPVLYCIVSNAPKVDGTLGEWDSTRFVRFCNGMSGALAISGDRLYAAYKTGKADLMENDGGQNGNIQTIFKTGGSLELFLATDSIARFLEPGWKLRTQTVKGDIRLSVCSVAGATKAVLFEAVVPGTDPANRVVYHSNIAHTEIDRVSDISASVTVAGTSGNFEFSVPLQVLGISPTKIVDGMTMWGDIGVLIGNGGKTVERIYWKNKNTFLTNDIPSEAAFQPNRWGLIRFKASGEVGTTYAPAMTGKEYSKVIALTGSGYFALSRLPRSGGTVRVLRTNGELVSAKAFGPSSVSENLEMPRVQGLYLVQIIGINGEKIERRISILE